MSAELRERIKSVIETEPVALFMKGTPQFVMCGNSERALQALRGSGAPVTTVDVLPDPEIRQELSALSGWPTISQLPVVRNGRNDSLADFIGSLQDRDLLDRVFKNPDALHEDVATAMQPPLAAVESDVTLDEVFATLTGRTNALVIASKGKPIGVLTRSDLLDYLAHQRG